jgi:predicted dehydrogenase
MMNALGTQPSENTDNASLLLHYENGSNVVINYFSNGSKQYSKERLEFYFQEKTIVMDNFRTTEAFGIKGFSKLKTKQDKGHAAQFERLNSLVKQGGAPLIPFDEIINTTRASFAAIESLKTGNRISL